MISQYELDRSPKIPFSIRFAYYGGPGEVGDDVGGVAAGEHMRRAPMHKNLAHHADSSSDAEMVIDQKKVWVLTEITCHSVHFRAENATDLIAHQLQHFCQQRCQNVVIFDNQNPQPL